MGEAPTTPVSQMGGISETGKEIPGGIIIK